MATTDVAALLTKGIEKHYGIEIKTVRPVGKTLFHKDTTGGRYLDQQGWIGYGAPQSRAVGMPVATDAIRPNFKKRFVMVGFSLGDIIADEDIMDDQYGMLVRWASSRGGSLAISYSTLEERVAADYFATLGFATAPVNGSPDGQPLFSTAHRVSAATSDTFATKPSVDIDLSMAAIQGGRAVLNQQMAPNNYTILENRIARLVVNPNLEDVAWQLIKSDWERGTADRNQNYLQKLNIDLVSWAYFRKTGAASPANSWNAWFLQGETHHMYWYDREMTSFDQQKLANVRSTGFYSHRRFAVGHTDARGFYGSTGL